MTLASAGEFTLENGAAGRYNLHLTVGTQLRATDPGVDQYGAILSRVVTGVPTGKLSGFTGG